MRLIPDILVQIFLVLNQTCPWNPFKMKDLNGEVVKYNIKGFIASQILLWVDLVLNQSSYQNQMLWLISGVWNDRKGI